METTTKPLKLIRLLVAALSSTAFALGFVLSYQDEQARFSEMASVAQAHLAYALQLKDDMAAIDWSKSLEKLPSVIVFQAKDQTHILAKGGNQNRYPTNTPSGLAFRFPDQWSFHSTGTSSANPFEFTILFQDQRGPLFWGLCFFLYVGLAGWLLAAKTSQKSQVLVSPPLVTQHLPKVAGTPTPVLNHVDPQSLILTLDKDYLICQITPGAAHAMGQEAASLLNHHFLDLLPDPVVMKAIADGQEIRLLKPFPAQPDLSATLKPVPNGTMLLLETSKVVERA